ncbi:MAG TPA: hypothetical protein VGM01_07715 [Ktedonobacteraceae bacterium]|jgi:hypothetical protein
MKQSAHVPLTLSLALFLTICFSLLATPLRAEAASRTDLSQSDPQTLLASHPPIDRDRDHSSRQAHEQKTERYVTYGGGPVMAGTSSVYAIFWEPSGNVSAHYNSLIKRYFTDIGKSPLYRIARQYKQANGAFPTNAVLAGTWTDTRAYRSYTLVDDDIQREVTRAQQVNGWHSSLNNLFFVFTERNANICMDSTLSECASNGYCAYHSAFGANTLYAIVPYQASFSCDFSSGPNHDDADAAIDNISHEQMESATDPLGNAWIDADGNEIGDKCVNDFGPLNASGGDVMWNHHPYLVQKEWDNQTGSCRLTP